ncbi:RadC family protein [Desulfoferrobacter suflitae]|uniref:RadC family protein n=1 Tax=Desulfoferrobacter suflitae TaxID=2865782 RepID=UPI0021645164|nr:DNA repair protein RadC [Desulfoferrobacter suflitae]MCK8602571.1 DNA repair protein RadC [Desulfoferrobacter suflitae]
MNLGPEGHRKRLRERFLRSGFDGFHDHELLELILLYAIPRRDVKPIAKALLMEFSSVSAVFDAPMEALQSVSGVGEHAAMLLSMIPRLVDRYHQDRWRQTSSFHSTQQAVAYLTAVLGTERNEVFCVLALNSRNGLIAREEIQRGSVNRTAVYPRLVVETSLKHRATAVILAHNHPGGDPSPSTADRQLTRKLKRILHDLDITVHDHIIIAGPRYFSFVEQGEME